MKIGILTQPIRNNYGGILQAFALYYVLENSGHEPWIINRDYIRKNIYFRLKHKFKYIISHYLLRREQKFAIPLFYLTKKENEILSQYTKEFVIHHIPNITKKIYKNTDLKECQRFDAYIVGSDQVWRPEYSPCIMNYFFDFVNDDNAIRLSYAASFGTDKNEFSEKQITVIRPLLSKFKAVSVREESGIKLCKDLFGYENAIHVLDPTMLIEPQSYIKNLNLKKDCTNDYFASYILDKEKEKSKINDELMKFYNISYKSLMPKETLRMDNRQEVDKCVFPPVEDWLNGILGAKFVITDSFHGTVFSILFNKSFVVLDNKGRGTARLSSLLKMFDLQDRIASNISDVRNIIEKKTEWESINNKIKSYRMYSMDFLINNLNKK